MVSVSVTVFTFSVVVSKASTKNVVTTFLKSAGVKAAGLATASWNCASSGEAARAAAEVSDHSGRLLNVTRRACTDAGCDANADTSAPYCSVRSSKHITTMDLVWERRKDATAARSAGVMAKTKFTLSACKKGATVLLLGTLTMVGLS
ncbi:hypothetical protein NESM_000930200 [Novymonas esmeraldas]|uniref:Uncharacterized protein n=1 Tax=Novymonas esmeraldas TaxID=1808958 RepID=A0AAW0F2U4_9TRYP